MRKKSMLIVIFVLLFLCITTQAQTDTSNTETKTRKPVFRATRDQITQAQKILKVGESGKMDADTRAAVRKYQSENGLKPTGTLNRATLEKMGIALTDKQKEIPADPGSYLSGTESKTTEGKKRGPVFRATKEQIMEAQKILREKGFYKGEESGKLDPATRAALRAYQEGNGLKATGTLNAATLEKMGIELTEKQKERVVLRTP